MSEVESALFRTSEEAAFSLAEAMSEVSLPSALVTGMAATRPPLY